MLPFSCASALASSWFLRVSESGAGDRRLAAEVSVAAKVEFEPDTERGAPLLAFLENLPPAAVDSAARESEATGPVDSSFEGADGSVTWRC